MSAGHARNLEARKAAARVGDLDFNFLIVEFAVPQTLAERVPGARARLRADHGVQAALLGLQMSLCTHLLALIDADERDRRLHKVADDLIDVAPDISDLGKFSRLHLQEGRICKLCEPARNLGLA